MSSQPSIITPAERYAYRWARRTACGPSHLPHHNSAPIVLLNSCMASTNTPQHMPGNPASLLTPSGHTSSRRQGPAASVPRCSCNTPAPVWPVYSCPDTATQHIIRCPLPCAPPPVTPPPYSGGLCAVHHGATPIPCEDTPAPHLLPTHPSSH